MNGIEEYYYNMRMIQKIIEENEIDTEELIEEILRRVYSHVGYTR